MKADPNESSCANAGETAMNTITIKILEPDRQSPGAKLADAEIHFAGGELDGLKLVGFAVWQVRNGHGKNVSFSVWSGAISSASSTFCGAVWATSVTRLRERATTALTLLR
jgi:hypothetical protein